MNEESIAKMKNSYDEQKLRDEVIYLHYLWQQGPPHHHHSQSNPILPHWRLHHDPFPPSHTRSLPPITSTSFKKKKVTKPRPIFSENRRVNVENNKVTKPDSPGWPVPVPVSQNSPQTGWPTPNPKSDPLPPPPPQPQDIERLSALHLQNKACKAFRDSLLIGSDNDDDDDDDDEDDDEDDNEDSDGSRFKQFENFFIEVFMEDNELRGYYQRCFEDGEFLCLVCAAEKKKNNKKKKYKDCIGLVQHSKLILRTANKVAHRAFGEVVCKVLGWDVNRFPTIVINGEPLGPVQSLGEPKESVAAAADDDGKDGPCETEVIAVSLEHAKDPVEEHAKGVDQSIAECSCKEGDIVENGGEEARYEMKGETKEKVVFGA